MAEERKAARPVSTAAPVKETKTVTPKILPPLFGKHNKLWIGIGAALIVLGMFLMGGGKNEDPNTFDYNVVYSTTRITIAPILIVLGLLIEIYAIFKKEKLQDNP